jgi:spore coat polysaccharide biosynthesis protein SpsF
MRTVAIIQARMGATRLPGKVLKQLAGKSVLEQVIGRVRQAGRLQGVMVATTTAPQDEAVVAECRRLGVPVFQGSEQDVLSRYHGAATAVGAEAVVRITADCPLFDGAMLDRMLEIFLAANQPAVTVDYLSNVQHRTFPRGLDAELFTFAGLDRIFREAVKPYEREHVTPYFYQHPELFRLRSFVGEPDHSAYRWTLDTPEDWSMIQAVYAALGMRGEMFGTEDILGLLRERPEIARLNAHVEQKKLGQ